MLHHSYIRYDTTKLIELTLLNWLNWIS